MDGIALAVTRSALPTLAGYLGLKPPSSVVGIPLAEVLP
jgi:hypothetical protein